MSIDTLLNLMYTISGVGMGINYNELNKNLVSRMQLSEVGSPEYENFAKQLIDLNAGFLYSKVKELNLGKDLFEDAMQEARWGLLESVKTYDPNSSEFLTYAGKNVMFQLSRWRSKLCPLTGMTFLSPKIRAAYIKLKKSGNNFPTIEDISNETGIQTDDIWAILSAQNIVSLDDPVNETAEGIQFTLGNYIEDKSSNISENYNKTELINNIHRAVDYLPDKLAYIVKENFFNGKTHDELGQTMGITRSRVQQLAKTAIPKLKYLMSEDVTFTLNKIDFLREKYNKKKVDLKTLIEDKDMMVSEYNKLINVALFKYNKRTDFFVNKKLNNVINQFSPLASNLILEVCILGKDAQKVADKYGISKQNLFNYITKPCTKIENKIELE